MNNAEHEPIVTKVDPLPFVVQRPDKDAETVSYRPAEKLPERPIEFSTWELITLKIDATLQATKFIGSLTPHIINIIWSWMMGNKSKLGVAIVGLITAALAHFDIVIPEALSGFINMAVLFVVGWLLPSPGGKKEEQP